MASALPGPLDFIYVASSYDHVRYIAITKIYVYMCLYTYCATDKKLLDQAGAPEFAAFVHESLPGRPCSRAPSHLVVSALWASEPPLRARPPVPTARLYT